MRLLLFKGNKELAAVNRAGKETIASICSTADQGNNHQKLYPATYQKDLQVECLIPVATCDKYGKLTDWSTTTEAKYNFRGKDVTAKPVRLMKGSKTYIGQLGSYSYRCWDSVSYSCLQPLCAERE